MHVMTREESAIFDSIDERIEAERRAGGERWSLDDRGVHRISGAVDALRALQRQIRAGLVRGMA